MYLFWNQNTKMGTHLRNKIYGKSSLKLLFRQCSLWQAVWVGQVRLSLFLCSLMSTYYFSLWQAVWRGYILRVRLEQALEFAKFEDEDDFDFQEVDLKDFNFNEVCDLHTAQLETCCFLRQSVFIWICIHIYVTFYFLSMINANFNIVYKPFFFCPIILAKEIALQ